MMDAVDFTYWLDGYLHDRGELGPKEMGIVRERMQRAIMREESEASVGLFERYIMEPQTEQ